MPMHCATRATPSRRHQAYQWGLVDFRGPALLADMKSRAVSELRLLRPALLGGADPGRREAERRPGGLQGQDRVRRRDRRRPVRRVRNAVRRAARCRASRCMPPSPTTSCRTASCARRPTAVRVASVLALRPGHRRGRDAAAGLVGDARRRCGVLGGVRLGRRTRLFAAGYWLNVTQPVLASAVALFGGVGLPVLRRGPREAEDEAAVRPVRLEGRLRSAGRATPSWRGSAGSGAR